MKHLTWIFALILLATACRYEQGSGNIVRQQRTVDAFTKLSVGGDFDVEVTTGASPSVTIMADDNVIEDIYTRVENGRLKITMKNGLQLRNTHMEAKITAPALSEVKASASARIKLVDELDYDGKLTLGASSGGRITGSIHAPSTVAEASSGATLVLAGQTRNLDADASSGASIKGYDLLSETTRAEASSGASVQVHASVQLDAHASSGGGIKYRGGAKVAIHKSSGGSVGKE